ncbi:pentatricopeptide repeat-containing protein At3g02490, mitochondrial-like [Telopea speciosissima]|uniref:pentatricopeptide repeat-containing protein At3g02490, mitochondrial-like n=1 Tax=Telopea speciosissima TaxID=54955 RepID=UPI001CC4270F|nr:pentatricopeptide repeat-containing protein At3g02490, mitochondrial-like [Telopea speciosissima]
MRSTWRLLLLRNRSRSSICTSTIEFMTTGLQVRELNPQKPYCFSSISGRYGYPNCIPLLSDSVTRNPGHRSFSSELAVEHKDPDHDHALLLADIFSRSSSPNAIRGELESNRPSVTHEMALTVLKNLDESPEAARRFFDWVSETHNEKLSSKTYNLFLGILGRKDHVKEFWDLVEIMRKKGYGVSKSTFVKVSENFEKEELASDLDKLKGLFLSKSDDNSSEQICSKVCKIIRQDEWSEDVQKRLRDLEVSMSSDLVAMVLERLSLYPVKALMFFRWIEANQSFKHNEQTYNAMAQVLGREDCIEKFWGIIDEMKVAGYEMEKETYLNVYQRFYKKKMIKEAVDLYEFAMMHGTSKPPNQDCTLLLKNIVTSKEDLDMDLFSRVVRIFTEGGGNALKQSTFDAVLKSLISVGKLGDCNKISKAMEKGGLEVSRASYDEIIFRLSRAGRVDEACEILNDMQTSGRNPDFKMWASLIHGQCVTGDVDKAHSCFLEMVEKKGVAGAGYAFEVLVDGFYHKNRVEDACKLLIELVNGKEFRPCRTTYKILIEKLLVKRNLKEALSLLELMKNNDYPPILDPFIGFLSKSGTGEDALNFLKAITSKRFPSTSVVLLVFEAFFKAGRHNEAHNCLSKCPHYIRNHADVLSLFCSMKPVGADATTVHVTA